MQVCSVSYEMPLISWLMLVRWGRTDSWGGGGTTLARSCQPPCAATLLHGGLCRYGGFCSFSHDAAEHSARPPPAKIPSFSRVDTVTCSYGKKRAYLPDRRTPTITVPGKNRQRNFLRLFRSRESTAFLASRIYFQLQPDVMEYGMQCEDVCFVELYRSRLQHPL